jgi:hypothetical protein
MVLARLLVKGDKGIRTVNEGRTRHVNRTAAAGGDAMAYLPVLDCEDTTFLLW